MMLPKPFDQTDHRPWEMPNEPWIMIQQWLEFAFLHWSLPPQQVMPYVPAGLTLDTYEGNAWIGVLPFRMSHVHPRFVPSVPWLSEFLEFNVRTYVVGPDGKKGIIFFSLDASNPVGVSLGRAIYKLPYFNAQMTLEREGNIRHYTTRRTHKNARPAAFDGSYRPVGEYYVPATGSLENFLVERYCLYTTNRKGQLFIGEIHHVPWRIAPAEATIRENTMSPIALPDIEPLMHYSEGVEVAVWRLRRQKV
jgi:uncharacterized protein